MRCLLKRSWPTAVGLSAMAVYLSWNACWLIAGHIPPSMLTGVTGIPSPTTGGTRSAVALMNGDLAKSIYYNPMTVPILGLFIVTMGQVILKRRGDNWLVAAWTTTLGIAWVVKLLSPPATW